MELAPLSILKIYGYCCDHSSAFILDWIFFILAGNKVNYKSLDGFQILLDQNLDCWVSCPWASQKFPIDL